MEGGDLQARSCGYRAIQLRSEATRIGQRFVELWHRDTRWSDKQP